MSDAVNPTEADDPLDAGLRQFHEALEQVLVQFPDTGEAEAGEPAARQVLRDLHNLIELQTVNERRGGGGGTAALAAPVRYLKAALADEILLSRPWAGRRVWPQRLLEAEMFRTSVAGDRVLADIERLLADREPSQRTLARLYLFALALGFQGRLRGQPEIERLAGLRTELFQFVYQRTPESGARDRVLSEQPYASTLSHLAPLHRRGVSRWALIGAIVLAGLLVLSELLWLWPTWPLRQALDGPRPVATEVSR